MKRRQKAGFLSPRSSKIIVTKEKERRKRKIEEKEIRRRKKSNGCTLSFYNKTEQKNCRTQKVHLAITLSKIPLEIRILKVVKSRPNKYIRFQFCVIRIEGRRDLESSRKRRKNQGIIKTHFSFFEVWNHVRLKNDTQSNHDSLHTAVKYSFVRFYKPGLLWTKKAQFSVPHLILDQNV